MYHIVVFVHVLSAIVAVGANATYAVWFARGSKQPEHLLFALRGVKFIDDRIANPAYGLLLITGVAQVLMSGRPFSEPWIAWALGLFALLGVVAFGFYSPALAHQIEVLAANGPDDPASVAANRRQTVFGALLMVVVLVIVALMVFRPGGA